MASSWLQRCIPHRPAARLLDSATSPRPGPRLGWRLDMCAGRVDGRVERRVAGGGGSGLLNCWVAGRWARLSMSPTTLSKVWQPIANIPVVSPVIKPDTHPPIASAAGPRPRLLFLPVAPAHDDMDMSGWCGHGGSGGSGGRGGSGAGLPSTLDACSIRGRVAALPAACLLPMAINSHHHHLTHHLPPPPSTLPQALPP
jgi:hypothetical protein